MAGEVDKHVTEEKAKEFIIVQSTTKSRRPVKLKFWPPM
jgi:hypothetical protein